MDDMRLTDRLAMWLSTGLGVGLVSPAPGTIGGLWGLPLAWLVGGLEQPASQVACIVAIGIASALLCSVAARVLGGTKDPQSIVLDEIAALPIAYLGIEERSPAIWFAGWLLFRVFDISKPPPVKLFERLPAGWGIMADDWAAAVYACLSLHALIWLDRTLELGWLAATV